LFSIVIFIDTVDLMRRVNPFTCEAYTFHYQCLMTPAIIKKFVITYVNTINVLMQAIRSDSSSELPDFSPRALAQIRQMFLAFVDSRVSTVFCTFHSNAIATIVGLLTYQLIGKIESMFCKLFCTYTVKDTDLC